MLSILIPIYNHDIEKLVRDLHLQCQNADTDYELILADDCSTDRTVADRNRCFLSCLPENIHYMELNENFGRSRIRNYLTNQAKGEWLLFLDCDSGIVRESFVQDYLSLTDKYDVVCGGTVYSAECGLGKEYLLHWKNGKHREENQKHFTTNNFLIRKEVFSRLRFDEQIKGYGHEDTLFACELRKNAYRIFFADNPVEHLGLKTTDKFISDTINASRNLKILYSNPKYSMDLQDLSLIKAYNRLNYLHIKGLYCTVFPLFNSVFIRQLHSSRPCLKFLDMIKLYHVCSPL